MRVIYKTWDQADADEAAMNKLLQEGYHDREYVEFWKAFAQDIESIGPDGMARFAEKITTYIAEHDHDRPTSTHLATFAKEIWSHWNWHETAIGQFDPVEFESNWVHKPVNAEFDPDEFVDGVVAAK